MLKDILNKIKPYLSVIIVAGAALLAFLLGIIFPGAALYGERNSVTVGLLGVMFGAPKFVFKSTSMTNVTSVTGGMSIFGLFSFLFLVAGIVLVITSIFIKGKKLDFIGSILIAVAGIFALLLLTCGTNVETMKVFGHTARQSIPFTDYYQNLKLGAGAILYGIVAILGGGFGVFNCFKKII